MGVPPQRDLRLLDHGSASLPAGERIPLTLSLDREILQWIRDALSYPRVELIPLATAVVEGAKLVTKDGNITDSKIVPVVW